jgi:hypothetical protein
MVINPRGKQVRLPMVVITLDRELISHMGLFIEGILEEYPYTPLPELQWQTQTRLLQELNTTFIARRTVGIHTVHHEKLEDIRINFISEEGEEHIEFEHYPF